MSKTIIWKRVDRLMLLVHSDESPAQEEWRAYASELVTAVRQRDIDALVVFTDSAGPSPSQRKAVAVVSEVNKAFQTTVITHAAFARGIVTALSWLGVNIKAFAPSEATNALAHAQVSEASREQVLATLASARLELIGLPDPAPSPERVRTVLEGKLRDLSPRARAS